MTIASTIAAVLLLTASFAFAQQAQAPATPKTEQPMGAMGGKMGQGMDMKGGDMKGMDMKGMDMGKMGGGMCMQGHGGMGMMSIPPEKREAVQKIHDEFKDKLFTLHQDVQAKQAELSAIMLQAQPDTAKAKTVAKEIETLKDQEMDVIIDMHAKITKETGVRLPMGMGMGMGMMGE
jgi:Spy/CpxP family protein refolding chaperone